MLLLSRPGGTLLTNFVLLATTVLAAMPGEAPAGTEPPDLCQPWTVLVRLTSSSKPVGSLQYRIEYSQSGGFFEGTGSDVACSPLQEGLYADNDNEYTRTVRVGHIWPPGLVAPSDLLDCQFLRESTEPLSAEDLPLYVEDASDTGHFPDAIAVELELVVLPDGAPRDCGPWCGNGVVDGDEVCDDGNASNDDDCRNDCSGEPSCGDGIVDAGEECDDGNSVNTDGCLEGCIKNRCGDGFPGGAHEECDDGNNSNEDACPTSCRNARCGDGYVYAGVEECDDGNRSNEDACLRTCEPASCGDGYRYAGHEDCDDANDSNTDACLNNCMAASCGDGFFYPGFEQCDDGNRLDGDGCPGACGSALCGDGVVNDDLEDCDDGNDSNEDLCLSNCIAASCGDGFLSPETEECDDGNLSDEDECVGDCRIAGCGDGFLNALTERCDDGNRMDGDGCSAICGLRQICGDAVPDGRLLARDAQRILKRAVGEDVECADWACRVLGSDAVRASDAQQVLRAAVGQPVTLNCGAPTSLVIRVDTDAPVTQLQMEVDLAQAAAELAGEGMDVECEGLVEAGFEFDKQAGGVLAMTVSAPEGLEGSRSVARCELTPTGPIDAEDFPVAVLDARSAGGEFVEGVLVRAVPY